MKLWFALLLWFYLPVATGAQQEYHVACIAFYNFENLFDTLDSPDTDDLEFTPHGSNLYTADVYHDKLSKLARVIQELGTQYTPDGPALLGVAEIENRTVLEDFVRQPAIASRGYKIIHQDSKDGRGVDVALLYQPQYFTPESVHYYALPTHNAGEEPRYSRDILIAIGSLQGQRIAVTVNHWPSRRGGEQATAHLRKAAADYNRRFLDSLQHHAGIPHAIVMGDLNDDPVNASVRKHLRSVGNLKLVGSRDLYNPFLSFYKKGIGTTAYQDAWSLFDQILLSHSLALGSEAWRYYKSGIYNPPYMTQKSGNFKGYPLRSYVNNAYTGGYSDHFPVYVLLVKAKS